MLSTFFLLTAALFGFVAASRLPVPLRFEERCFAALPIGLAVGGLVGYLYALAFGMGAGSLIVPSVLLALGAAVSWPFDGRVGREFADLRERLRTRGFRFGAVAFLGLAALLGTIMWGAIFADGGSIYAGFDNVWGDWNQHLAQTTSFAFGENFPTEQTALSGQKITYPLLTNFVSAMLVTGGVGLLAAMKVPGVLLVISGLGMLTAFIRLTAGPKAMLVGAALFYLFGGLGFVNLIADFAESGQSLGAFFAALPHEYTLTHGDVLIPNINFINPIFAYLIPQRAFLFGLPLTLTIICLLYAGLKQEKPARPFLAAGLLACLLPLVHTHSLVFLGLLTPGLIVFTWKRLTRGRPWRVRNPLVDWSFFIMPILIFAIPQVLWLSSGVNSYLFFRPQLGWTAHDDFIPWFWLKNLGLFLPLLVFAMFWLRKRDPLLLQLTGAAALVWLIANIYVFQPWDWDNTKFFVYWLILSIPAVSLLLVRGFERGRLVRIAVLVIAPFLILAGAADASRTVQPDHYRAELFDTRAQDVGAAVRQKSAPDSVWLTAQPPNNPVAALAGRRLVLGYTGWLWSYGLDYAEREQDVRRMLEGDSATDSLLSRYGVDYVVIGPPERGDKGYEVNEPYFADRYPVWERFKAPDGNPDGTITIYRISGA